jgi:hypothetical protein
VRRQPGLIDRSRGRVEPRPPGVAVAEHASFWCRKDEFDPASASKMLSEFVDEEAGDRHHAPLVVLRRVPHELAAVDLGDGLGDVEAASQEIDILNP